MTYNPDKYPPPTYRGLQAHYKDLRDRGYRVFGDSLLLNALNREAEKQLQLTLGFATQETS